MSTKCYISKNQISCNTNCMLLNKTKVDKLKLKSKVDKVDFNST